MVHLAIYTRVCIADLTRRLQNLDSAVTLGVMRRAAEVPTADVYGYYTCVDVRGHIQYTD
jgi:hypothetical protein